MCPRVGEFSERARLCLCQADVSILTPKRILCSREESNLYCRIRNPVSYPLNDEHFLHYIFLSNLLSQKKEVLCAPRDQNS